jgi:hypothetical protein
MVCAQVRIIHFVRTCAQNDVLLAQGWPTDPVAAGRQACCFSCVVADGVNHASVHFFGACLRGGVADGGPGGSSACTGAHALGLLRLECDGAGVAGGGGIAPTAAHGRPVGPTGCTCRRWWSRCWDATAPRGTSPTDHVPEYVAVRAHRARVVQHPSWTCGGHAVLQGRLRCATGLGVRLNDYVLMCLILGSGVRNCKWEWAASHTGGGGVAGAAAEPAGADAAERGSGGGDGLVCTACVALLLWTDWQDTVPAAWYCEGTYEATLTRLSILCRRHT